MNTTRSARVSRKPSATNRQLASRELANSRPHRSLRNAARKEPGLPSIDPPSNVSTPQALNAVTRTSGREESLKGSMRRGSCRREGVLYEIKRAWELMKGLVGILHPRHQVS